MPGPAADTLQKLPVKVVTYEKCHAEMKYLDEIRIHNGLHPDKTMCAGGEYGNVFFVFLQLLIEGCVVIE